MVGFNYSSNKGLSSSYPWPQQVPYFQDLFRQGYSWLHNRPDIQGTRGLDQSLFDHDRLNMGGSVLEQILGNTLQRNLTSPEQNNPWSRTITSHGNRGNPYADASNPYADASNPYADASNPYVGASNPYIGAQNPFVGALGSAAGAASDNPYLDDIMSAGNETNPYLSSLGPGMGWNPYIQNVAQHGDQNPWLDRTFDRASQSVSDRFTKDVIPGLNATFGSAGRTGGGLHGQTFTDAAGQYGDTLNNLATDIYGGAYESDQNRRLTRDISAGQLAESGLGRLLSGGTTLAGFGENALNRRLGAAGTAAGFAGSGMDNALRALTAAAGFAGDDLNRSAGLYGDDLNRSAGLYGDDLNRSAGLYGDDLNRSAGLYGQDFDRSSRLYGDDYNRSLSAALANAGLYNTTQDRGLERFFGTADRIPGYEGLLDNNINQLRGWSNRGINDLQAYRDLIGSAIMESRGSNYGSGGGFGLPINPFNLF